MRLLLLLTLCTLIGLSAKAQDSTEIRTYIDLQIHPTMHVPYGFFSKGLEYIDQKKKRPKESWKHQFRNVNYADYLRNNAGARVIVNGALNRENVRRAKKARRVIMEQIDYVNRFAAENSEHFVVARSPAEVRHYVQNTNKTVILHSIEGARRLVNSQEDADFWASQGVVFMTLIHLVDCENGGAAIQPPLVTKLLNFKGLLKPQHKRGLTKRGKQMIIWLANAGIMTDITHMSDQTRKDALNFMQQRGLPPLATHDLFKPIHNQPRGIDTADVIQIYQNNGLMSLPISGESCRPYRPRADYKAQIDSLQRSGCYCEGSIDDYQFSYTALKKFVETQTTSAVYGKPFEQLTEAEKVQLSIGFQSDFNGWLNHSRPRYGKDGCWKIQPDSSYFDIETQGMPHAGLLSSQWAYLEHKGVDLAPIRRSSEKFLQMWQFFLDKKGSWDTSVE